MVTLDLTGWWIGNDQPSPASYFVRHFTGNDDIFWAGLHESGFHPGLQFTNVFRGRLDSHRRQITGDWVDVPRGKEMLRRGRLTLDVMEPTVTPSSDGSGLGRGDRVGGTPGSQAGPELRQVPQGTTGGFSGTVLRQVPPSNFSYPQDITDLFSRVRRGGPNPMIDDLLPFKDFAVIQGFIGAREYSYGWDAGYPQDYCIFVDPTRGPQALQSRPGLPPPHGPYGDGDINFDLELDDADRAALDQQPGFWTSGWVSPNIGPYTAAEVIQSKLFESRAFHCEMVMFGREQTHDDCANSFGGLLPAWAESEGNSVLINGLPINGRAYRAQPEQNLYYTYFCLDSPEFPFRQELRQASRVRVTGVITLDHGHWGQPAKLEIHPVYSIDFQQDFQDRSRRSNADLSGVWHCNDVGTYYVRQVDSKVWWLGLSRDQGRTFANVFQGTIDPGGNIISGDWADVPIGINGTRSNGGLYLRLDGSGPLSSTFVAVNQTGGPFGGTAWYKLFDRPFGPGSFPPRAAADQSLARQSRFVTWHPPYLPPRIRRRGPP